MFSKICFYLIYFEVSQEILSLFQSRMHKQTIHKELHDPFAHYTRGVLVFDKERFTFIAYRVPYMELNKKSWKTEQEFTDDYRRLIARKYYAES